MKLSLKISFTSAMALVYVLEFWWRHMKTSTSKVERAYQ